MREHPFRSSPRLLGLAFLVSSLSWLAPVSVLAQSEEAAPPTAESAESGEAAAESAAAVAPEPATAEEGAPEPAPPEEDLAADFFLSRCSGCHTIGEGELIGPDLAPATEWPAGDLSKAVARMEKNVGPMTGEQVAGLVELLKDEELKPRLSVARERQMAEMAATLEPPSPALGEALFHGRRAFGAGGVACASCHRVREDGRMRGGTLAVELTGAASKLGEQALVAAAETPGFPLMRAAYADHPVSRQEAVHVAAYLAEVGKGAEEEGDRAIPAAASAPLATRSGLWGGGAAVLFLAAMTLFYRGRNRGVRARLVRQAHQR